jgi:Bacterial Ig-like domain (group 2)
MRAIGRPGLVGAAAWCGQAAARLLVAGAAAAFAVACGGGGGNGGGGGSGAAPVVARVVVSPTTSSVDVGQTVQFGAQAFDASGAMLSRSFTWASSDTTKATVDANGLVTGVAAGAVSITATADSVTSMPAALTVNTSSVPAQSSFEMIDAALASGAIDAETALSYKVFATFGDSRLPAAYQGNDADIVDTNALDQVMDNWPTLSDAAKQTLAPFLIPPAYADSWANLATAKATREAHTKPATATSRPKAQGNLVKAQDVLFCQLSIDPNWIARPATTGGRVKVWYDSRFPDGLRQADFILNEVESIIWPKLVDSVGMLAPLSDAAQTGCNGGDGRLDIFIVSMTVSGQTGTDLGETFPVQWARNHTPAYILLSRALVDDNLKATAAHEFMHASQWAYPLAASVSSYAWLKEATAQSAIDVVYPSVQLEQRKAPPYMDTPDRSLDDTTISDNRTYGSYLFFQFLNRTLGPNTLASIWNAATAQSDQALAADQGIPGGFKEQWPKFAKLLWNQDPVNTNSFDGWDALTLTPALRGGGVLPIRLNGAPGATQLLEGNIKHLASHYYQFRIADPNIRSFSFFNHIQAFAPAANPPVATQAFITLEGGIPQYEHWSDETIDKDGVKAYCLDLKAERVTDLVIVMSNRDPQQDITSIPAQLQPRVSVSNVGCWRYKGSASVSASGSTPSWKQFTSSGDGSVTLERYRPSQMPNGAPGKETFAVLQGAITGRIDATDLADCHLTESSNDNMTPGIASGSMDVELGLDIGIGVVSRNVSGSGSAAGQTHIVLACPGVDPVVTDAQNAWDWFELPTPAEMQVEVKPDGTIQGSLTRALSNGATGSETLIWNFTPQRE